MATRTATITIDADLAAAYNTAPKMRQREALSYLRQALHVTSRPRRSPHLSKRETSLFLKINRNLTEEKQARFEALTAKRLDDKLTAAERAELEGLIREVEQIWVERLQSIGELARLRKVSPATLMQQLELDLDAEAPSEK